MNAKKRNYAGKPGAIYRIALENFVTYKEVELYPGPNLNMIIGPNGTGKSTFVCAIVLGLCGKTNVIGRAKQIGEYVKSGHQEATIEIELFQNPGEENVIITRSFNLANNSVWSINKKPAKMKQVQDLIESLNIRVDNLCQLLPQDRVQDFAKMNPQELLKSTQIAVSGQEAVDLLGELIENKVSHRNILANLNSSNKTLQEQEQLNARLQGVISSIQQMKKMEEEIELCQKKKVWAEYEQCKLKLDDLVKDKVAAAKLLETHKSKMAPVEHKINDLKKIVTSLEEGQLICVRRANFLKQQIKKTGESFDNVTEKILEFEAEVKAMETQNQNRKREMQQARVALAKMESDRNNLLQSCGDESSLKLEMANLQKPITKANTSIDVLKNERSQLQYELDSRLIPQQKSCENKLQSLNNIANKRLETLKSVSEHTYRAVEWLRNNEEMFQGNVYEPMLLEINFTEPRFARYLENTVSNRDLIAFTFESSEDMNLFMKKVRGELKLNMVNAVCSKPARETFHPPVHINELKSLGFFSYLVDLITGPEAIIRYLCRLYGIHKIPIGNADTYKKSQNVPNNITLFFSENHRFSSKVSSYTGAKLTSSTELRPAKLLATAVDPELMSNVERQLAQIESQVASHKTAMKSIDCKMANLDENVNELITRRKKLQESLEQIKTVHSRIRMQQNKVKALEAAPDIDVEKESERMQTMIKCYCKDKLVKFCQDMCETYKECQNKELNKNLIAVKISFTRQSVQEVVTELRELKSNAQTAEHTLENITRLMDNAKNAAKDKIREAKSLTGPLLPHQEGFPLAEAFSRLPAELEELLAHMEELQNKVDCMDGEDNGKSLLKEYEDRINNIKKIGMDVSKLTKEANKLEDRMKQLSDRWLLPLEKQVEEINTKFSNMLTQMGCAGQITISKPGGEDDYDQYGISIMIRFRENEQLQQLTQYTQSGGERALATALYLMALQQLSKAPFRCVDEINQGMDPINERRMFQLLVSITTECDASSQYFLLTPKLLTNLQYTPSIKVHTIENGPRIIKYRHWNIAKFINNARNYSD